MNKLHFNIYFIILYSFCITFCTQFIITTYSSKSYCTLYSFEKYRDTNSFYCYTKFLRKFIYIALFQKIIHSSITIKKICFATKCYIKHFSSNLCYIKHKLTKILSNKLNGNESYYGSKRKYCPEVQSKTYLERKQIGWIVWGSFPVDNKNIAWRASASTNMFFPTKHGSQSTSTKEDSVESRQIQCYTEDEFKICYIKHIVDDNTPQIKCYCE